MAKALETRGAKLLALLLALIMLVSVLVYALRGAQKVPEREVIYQVNDFKEMMKLLSDSSEILYLNFRFIDANLTQFVDAYYRNIVYSEPLFTYNYIGLISLNSLTFVLYPSDDFGLTSYMYLLDSGSYKVFFRHDSKEEYDGVTIKKLQGYAMAENVNPVPVGVENVVYDYVDKISGKKKVESNYTEFIDNLPDLDYKFALVLFGEMANSSIAMNGTDGEKADFYFEGIALNESGGYDKVIAINFKQNIFFVESNVTEYYNVTRYDSLNIAFMHDKNFTKIIEAKPEMRAVFIKPVDTSENETGS